MKKMIFKVILLPILISPSVSISSEFPSNSLQMEYKKQLLASEKQNSSWKNFYNVPQVTYQFLDDVFTSLYQKVTLNTAITDSTFKNNSHYEMVSIPFIADTNQGINVELFGNFSDSSTQRLSNVSSDQALYNYYSNTELFNLAESELAVGAGFSFQTSKDTKIKVIISNKDMPGYGNSNALFGIETSF